MTRGPLAAAERCDFRGFIRRLAKPHRSAAIIRNTLDERGAANSKSQTAYFCLSFFRSEAVKINKLL